jgi:hypothetical protein
MIFSKKSDFMSLLIIIDYIKTIKNVKIKFKRFFILGMENNTLSQKN